MSSIDNTSNQNPSNMSPDNDSSNNTPIPSTPARDPSLPGAQHPQLLFTPTVFTVWCHIEGGRDVAMRPQDLVNGVPRSQITTDNLMFERFWEIFEHDSGLVAGLRRLMLQVPDNCGNPGVIVPIENGMKWRAALQQCHNAGMIECEFWVFPDASVAASTSKMLMAAVVLGCYLLWYFFWGRVSGAVFGGSE